SEPSHQCTLSGRVSSATSAIQSPSDFNFVVIEFSLLVGDMRARSITRRSGKLPRRALRTGRFVRVNACGGEHLDARARRISFRYRDCCRPRERRIRPSPAQIRRCGCRGVSRYSPPMQALADLFAPEGILASRLPGFSYREAQARMAAIVADALAGGGHVAIEAGTGIGKTFAYLVPVLPSGRRAIVSTGTRTLQDQLFARDLPRLGRVLGRPVDVALLKGRNNYLCWHRLELVRSGGDADAGTLRTLEAVRAWAHAGGSGDLT